MKILTILGTRPEIIRLSQIIPKLNNLCEHVIVHTGQNYSPELNDIFFNELGVRKPNYQLYAKGTFAEQLAIICTEMEKIFEKEKPDKFLVLGDTNSSLAAIIAKRMGIPTYHMEAGNRCFDDRVPEETNRRIIDHSSTVLMPYTERSRQNLLAEGIPSNRIYVTGNPIKEVINHYKDKIDKSNIIRSLNLNNLNYFLVTMHRSENIDNTESLTTLLGSLTRLGKQYNLPVIVSTHPHTQKMISQLSTDFNTEHVRFLKPFGFFDFIKLQTEAKCVISDSGTVQEECAILDIPNITIRQSTERPETIECGSSIVTGINEERIIDAVNVAITTHQMVKTNWNPPIEYQALNVSNTVVKILFSAV